MKHQHFFTNGTQYNVSKSRDGWYVSVNADIKAGGMGGLASLDECKLWAQCRENGTEYPYDKYSVFKALDAMPGLLELWSKKA